MSDPKVPVKPVPAQRNVATSKNSAALEKARATRATNLAAKKEKPVPVITPGEVDLSKLLTVKQVVEKYPMFTLSYMNKLVRNREALGFAPVVVTIGNRTFIDEKAFSLFINANRG